MVSRPERRVEEVSKILFETCNECEQCPTCSHAVHANRSRGKSMNVWDLAILVIRYLPLVIKLVIFIAKKAKNKRRPSSEG